MDNFMASMITRDFDVEFVTETSAGMVFCAQRDELWHFVFAATSNSSMNVHTGGVSQFHVPRYLMALMVERMLITYEDNEDLLEENPNRYLADYLILDHSISIRAGKKLDISVLSTERGDFYANFPQEFIDALQQDIPILEQARALVHRVGDQFVLPDEKTWGGNPITSSDRLRIEAIAFEKLVLGELNARRFGIYSAYCSLSDFSLNDNLEDQVIEGLLEHQRSVDSEAIPADINELFMQFQKRNFSSPIWGIDEAADAQDAFSLMKEFFAELSPIERTQFCLLNGMHESVLLLALATVKGDLDFKQYCDLITSDFQPDSEAEQSIRISTAYIEMFGRLSLLEED